MSIVRYVTCPFASTGRAPCRPVKPAPQLLPRPNLTVPMVTGVVPSPSVTVAVKVTGWGRTEGLMLDVMVVTVGTASAARTTAGATSMAASKAA